MILNINLLIWLLTLVVLCILLSIIFGTIGYIFRTSKSSSWFEKVYSALMLMIALSPFLWMITGLSIEKMSRERYQECKYSEIKNPIIALQDTNSQDISGSFVFVIGDLSTNNNTYYKVMEQVNEKHYITTYDASKVPLVFDDNAYVEKKYQFIGRPNQPKWYNWYIGDYPFKLTGVVEITLHTPQDAVKRVYQVDLK